jgi:hypothetical protein
MNGERNLRYSDWEYTRRLHVEERGGAGRGSGSRFRSESVSLGAWSAPTGGPDAGTWLAITIFPLIRMEALVPTTRDQMGGRDHGCHIRAG